MCNSPGKPQSDQKKLLNTPQDLAEMARSLSLELPLSEDLSILAQPVQLGELVVPNSLAIHPMEGCDGDSLGRPGPLAVRRYERYALAGLG